MTKERNGEVGNTGQCALMVKRQHKACGPTLVPLRSVVVVLVLWLSSAAAAAQTMAVSQANAGPSPANSAAGKMRIAPQFDDAWPFSEGLARVKQNGKWGFIDKAGALAIPPSFEEAESFSEGLARVKQNGKWGFIDRAGKVVVAPGYRRCPALHRRARCSHAGRQVGIHRQSRVNRHPADVQERQGLH